MKLTIYTDGGSLNNPGKAGIGFLIYNSENLKIPLYTHSEAIGVASNNVAEYTALIQALEYINQNFNNKKSKEDIDSITVVSDSQLMVRQLNGEYKVKHADIKPLHSRVKLLEMEMGISILYTHVLREKNKEADALVKKALM